MKKTKVKKKKTWEVPIMEDGSIPHYVGWSEENHIKEWKDPDEFSFEAVLQFQHTCRGQSAAYFVFKNVDTGATYPMFLSDMEDLLKRRIIAMGQLGGIWSVVKHGHNYGIRDNTILNNK